MIKLEKDPFLIFVSPILSRILQCTPVTYKTSSYDRILAAAVCTIVVCTPGWDHADQVINPIPR